MGLAALAACAVGYGVSRPLHARRDKKAALATLAFMPLFSLMVYLAIGNPDSADAPLELRLEGALEDLPPGAVMAKLEQRLSDAPNDATGWLLMARLRMTIEDYPKAADSWQRLLALESDNSEAMVGLAQALIEQDGGVVSEAAVDLLDTALASEPENFAARFCAPKPMTNWVRRHKHASYGGKCEKSCPIICLWPKCSTAVLQSKAARFAAPKILVIRAGLCL